MRSVTRRSFIGKFSIGVGAAFTAPSLQNTVKANAVNTIDNKLNIAICGLGNYGSFMASQMAESQYCKLAGIVTGHPSKAADWKKQYAIPDANIYNYQNFDSIVHNKDIDLVYVILPNAMHKEFTIRAAKAGKHVICEKPMATSSADCIEMIKTCNDAGVYLAIGYRLHYEPYHLELKRLGQEKEFGPVRFIEAGLGYKTYDLSKTDDATFNINDPAEWRLKKAMGGGGPLMDLGIYALQSSRYVLGEEPFAVTAQFGPVHNKQRFAEVEESISWQLEFPGGAVANCVTSVGFDIDRFYASADDGSFELSPALSYGPFKGKTTNGEIHFPAINQQATQLDAIGKLILENKPLPAHITGEEGLKDITIIEAIYKAANTGHKISLAKY
jgi:predicted dehydrogenase